MIDVDRLPPPDLGPFARPRPSMRGRYLIRHPLKVAAVAIRDALLRLVSAKPAPVPQDPRRILLANWGHLGDVVTTLGMAAALRKRFPQASLGIVVGSWGAAPARASGLFDTLHVIDHAAINRSAAGRGEKRARHRATQATAMVEISAAGYDLAIDCYPFHPPAHPIFHRAGIPVRAGFVSGGCGPLLTHQVAWDDASLPIAGHYRALLHALWPDQFWSINDMRPRAARCRPPSSDQLATPYIVLHPGAGAAYKDWGTEKWRTLASLLRDHPATAGFTLVVTGAGAGELAVASQLKNDRPDLLDLAGHADWPEFEAIVASAALVICPDTVTAHLAAKYDTPVLAIFTGANDPAQWGPYSAVGHVVVQAVACAPCNRPGCGVMACIAGTTPQQVLERTIAILASPATPLAQR